jgi:hypothetical protein
MSRLWFGQDAPMSPTGLAGKSPSGRGAPNGARRQRKLTYFRAILNPPGL